MRRAIVEANGDVRCPHCGAKNNFVSRRSVGKIVALGVFGAKPQLRCVGCGQQVEPGKPARTVADTRTAKSGGKYGRCAKNQHYVKRSAGACPIDGSEIL